MNILYGILRTLHIFSGALWVGTAVMFTFVVTPAVQKTKMGSQVFRAMFTQTPYIRIMPFLAITTTVAGLLLYAPIGDIQLINTFNTTGHAVLGIGAIAGLLAFGHGIGLGSMSGKFAGMITSNDASEEELKAMEDKIIRNARISVYISLVAIIFMSSARWMNTVFAM